MFIITKNRLGNCASESEKTILSILELAVELGILIK